MENLLQVLKEATLFILTAQPVSYTHLDVYKRQALPDVEKGGHPADWDEVRTFKPESNNRMHALRAFYLSLIHI